MDLREANAQRWQEMKINPVKAQQFKNVADKILMNKARYQAVSMKTSVPWEVIGVIHYRESSCNFNTYLGNGEPLSRKTRLVPRGRGPFATWEEGAIDALMNASPKAGLNKDWSIGGTLDIVEKYNGLGYARMDKPSPYVWAGTDQYTAGKYVADGVYDPSHVDTQLGCAGILSQLGYKKASVSAPATSTTTAVAVGTGAAAYGLNKYGIPDLMNFVTEHWVALLIGAGAFGIAVDVLVNYLKRKKNV